MIKNSLIWVLTDDRPGNYWQAIGLADELVQGSARQYKTKKITYNSWIKLPNFLKFSGLIGISKESRFEVLNQIRWPQIIISAGRRTAPLALFLKRHYSNATFSPFVIQIMNPDLSCTKFDLVVVPNHDDLHKIFKSDELVKQKIAEIQNQPKTLELQPIEEWQGSPIKKSARELKAEKFSNILISQGSLNRIGDKLLRDEYRKFSSQLDLVFSPKIAVLIGGSSKHGRYNQEIATEFANILADLAVEMEANLLITTSRRTDKIVIDTLKNSIKTPYILFEWEARKPNPYFALLHAADFIIVTGDSVSMCSEACSTGKPVYIYNPEEICSEKHLKLHQYLFLNDFAKQLTGSLKILKDYLPGKLSETARIADRIKQILLSKGL